MLVRFADTSSSFVIFLQLRPYPDDQQPTRKPMQLLSVSFYSEHILLKIATDARGSPGCTAGTGPARVLEGAARGYPGGDSVYANGDGSSLFYL